MDRSEITVELAAKLVAAQFPEWADLPVTPVPLNGWDNTTFRLGDTLSIRLPSGAGYAAQVEKEHRWLPRLARQLPLPIPEPVALGRADDLFPWPWSVYRWIEGQPASLCDIADRSAFATDLVGFLTALHSIDTTDGPGFGKHSQFRGGPIDSWDDLMRESIVAAAGDIDTHAVTDAWEATLAKPNDAPPVWVHGDVTPSNLLALDGRLSAVIDFGCSATGDPACDLVMAWTFFDGESRSIFRNGLPLDDATWTRARGWALWKAVLTLAYADDPAEAEDTARRFGWRFGPHDVIERVLADQP